MTEMTPLIQGIQYALAPAVVVSSAALLLLGLQAKFSNLASRFRVLQHERRTLALQAGGDSSQTQRLGNVQAQLEQLMRRAACVKRAIMLAYAAIVCCMGSSVLIFLNVYAAFQLGHAVIGLFMLGLACVLAGALVMVEETRLFYRVLLLEQDS